MSDDKIRAPFTDEQIEALNAFQECRCYHPFTCGNDSRHRDLIATKDGWICLDCDYTQQWAHGFMATPEARTRWQDLLPKGPTP